jgi:molybdopterin-containing oxidoreductase family membrane subunit
VTNKLAATDEVEVELPLTYVRFLRYLLGRALNGGRSFYVVMFVLTAVALAGLNAWAYQVAEGMALTQMSDHVSWGLYIANFTFGVGLAAGAVMMVIPAYLYDDHEMHDVVIIGEVVAIAAIVACTMFIVADMGRPDRLWHILPGLGRFNWPISMLTWDVIVLNGYLLINLHIVGYTLYQRFQGKTPAKRWYVPFVFVSIFWAISIHTVTAFLYAGLGGRPFWNSALLAPRFIASAFISGPAFVILLLDALRRFARVRISIAPTRTLERVLRVTVLINIFMFLSEVFTAFYTGGNHAAAIKYLFWGSHGGYALVPWTWASLALNVTSVILLYLPGTLKGNLAMLHAACVCAFTGVWIEKGMGLIIPGFVPSTLHEMVEYAPSLTEWRVSTGIWSVGAMVLILGVKFAAPVLSGRVRSLAPSPLAPSPLAPPPEAPPPPVRRGRGR